MPWEQLLNGASGVAAIAIVVGVMFAIAILNKSADAFGRRLDAEVQHLVDSRRIALEGQNKYLELTRRLLLERTESVDADLRKNRETVYRSLWKKTAALPQWPRNDGLTYGDLVKMSGQFRDWYFNEGGLYLSKSARDAYGQAQGAITAVTDGRDSATRVNDADYEAIRIHCSNLRK